MAKGKSIGITIAILVIIIAGVVFYAYKKTGEVNTLSEKIESLETELNASKEKTEQMKKVSETMAAQAVEAETRAQKAQAELADCRDGR
ncbi:MAG: hypothetical protein WBA74_22765 [Cyclobacteriaceae bacterium]